MPQQLVVHATEKPIAQSDIHKFRAETGLCPAYVQAVQAAAACQSFRSSDAKSLWSLNVPKTGGIPPSFQRAFCKTSFSGSNPLEPGESRPTKTENVGSQF